MENKEVEDALFYISTKARRDPYTDPALIKHYHGLIVDYIENLEQLQTKDKALDKACKKLSDEVYVESIDGYLDVERWKEWCEDETN